MCRLFGQISLTPRSAVDLLIDSKSSLLEQSRAKKGCLQKDGWGVGWFEAPGRAKVIRSPLPIFKEEPKLHDAAEKANSTVVVAHVRAASNPLKLPKERLYNVLNNQPFTDGKWLFAHNGTLNIPKETARALGPRLKKLHGENDSEVWFQHLRKHLDLAGSFHEAAQAAILELWDIWQGCKKKHPGMTAPYTSLNIIASDGEALYALNHSAYRGMASLAACRPDQPWQLMSWSQRPDRVVIGSEGFDGGAWTMFSPPDTLSARARDGRFVVERKPLSGVPQTPLALKEAVS